MCMIMMHFAIAKLKWGIWRCRNWSCKTAGCWNVSLTRFLVIWSKWFKWRISAQIVLWSCHMEALQRGCFLKDAVQNVLDLTTCMQLVCVSVVSYYTFHLKKMCTLICVEIECIKKAREGKVLRKANAKHFFGRNEKCWGNTSQDVRWRDEKHVNHKYRGNWFSNILYKNVFSSSLKVKHFYNMFLFSY